MSRRSVATSALSSRLSARSITSPASAPMGNTSDGARPDRAAPRRRSGRPRRPRAPTGTDPGPGRGPPSDSPGAVDPSDRRHRAVADARLRGHVLGADDDARGRGPAPTGSTVRARAPRRSPPARPAPARTRRRRRRDARARRNGRAACRSAAPGRGRSSGAAPIAARTWPAPRTARRPRRRGCGHRRSATTTALPRAARRPPRSAPRPAGSRCWTRSAAALIDRSPPLSTGDRLRRGRAAGRTDQRGPAVGSAPAGAPPTASARRRPTASGSATSATTGPDASTVHNSTRAPSVQRRCRGARGPTCGVFDRQVDRLRVEPPRWPTSDAVSTHGARGAAQVDHDRQPLGRGRLQLAHHERPDARRRGPVHQVRRVADDVGTHRAHGLAGVPVPRRHRVLQVARQLPGTAGCGDRLGPTSSWRGRSTSRVRLANSTPNGASEPTSTRMRW